MAAAGIPDQGTTACVRVSVRSVGGGRAGVGAFVLRASCVVRCVRAGVAWCGMSKAMGLLRSWRLAADTRGTVAVWAGGREGGEEGQGGGRGPESGQNG